MITQFTPVSKILVFLINVTGISLIITVLMEDVKPILRRIFILMSILMFMWVDLAFFARIVYQTEPALFSIKTAWSITPLMFILIYSFIVNFLEKADKYKLFTVISYILGVIFLFIVLSTNLVISDIFYSQGILNIKYGWFVWFFFGIVTFYTFLNFYLLIKYYRGREITKGDKHRLKYLIFGLSVLFIANGIFNIILPVFFNIFHLYEFGDYTTVVFIILIAYAIVRRQMFGVKVVAASFLVSFLGSFLLIDAFIFSETITQGVLKGLVFLLYIPFGFLLIRSVLVEVSQRRRLQELTKKLKALGKQKDEFISMAAHELRSPMTAIKGYLSMILEGDAGEVTEKAHGYMTDAKAVTDRSIRLVNNMLNVARIEEGRLVYQMEEASLIKATQEIYNSFAFEAERKSLSYKLNVKDGVRDLVYVDPDKVREIIGNLVSNAVKFTEKGSVDINITNPEKDKVKVEIVDTGPGISKKEQEKLFNKFYRAESTKGKTMGTGLGLYISRRFIEKFNGEIGLDSDSGKGSNFWFEIPLIGSESQEKSKKD